MRYVARFATSKAKLRTYIVRKLRERGWEGEDNPPIEAIVTRLCDLGYVDDKTYASSLARSLGSRGYGQRRVAVALSTAGIEEADARDALGVAGERSLESALHFAKKRRIGPFAAANSDRATREKWIAAMIRAGHGIDLARRIADSDPGVIPEEWQNRQ